MITSKSFALRGSFGTPWVWVALIAVASVALSSKLSCATPFAALATLAALHMRSSQGYALVGLSWALNQVVGYAFLDYPVDGESLAWGAMIGVAALATFATATAVAARVQSLGSFATMALTLAAGFGVYEIVLFAATAVLPATEVAFSWPVVAEIGLVNALVFPALLGVQRLVVALGLVEDHASA